jgi:hypothetical protein
MHFPNEISFMDFLSLSLTHSITEKAKMKLEEEEDFGHKTSNKFHGKAMKLR